MSRQESRALISQRTADEEDARERTRRTEEAEANEREERDGAANAAQTSSFRKKLQNWDDARIMAATDFDLIEPKPTPVGSDKFSRFLKLPRSS